MRVARYRTELIRRPSHAPRRRFRRFRARYNAVVRRNNILITCDWNNLICRPCGIRRTERRARNRTES